MKKGYSKWTIFAMKLDLRFVDVDYNDCIVL